MTEKPNLTPREAMAHLMSPKCVLALQHGTRIFAWQIEVPRVEVLRLLERVIFAGQAGCPLQEVNEGIAESLVRAGILVLHPSTGHLTFSAPAVRQVVLLRYLAPARQSPSEPVSDGLQAFLLRALPRIDSLRLQQSYALGADGYPSEACWQYLLCSVLNDSFPMDSVSPDVGHKFGSKGRVDFYINSTYGWGIELTREHDRLEQHFLRFLPKGTKYHVVTSKGCEERTSDERPGTYYGMIAQGTLRQWLLVDFCHDIPTTWIDDSHVLHVVHTANLDGAVLWQCGRRIAAIDFLNSVQALQRGLSGIHVSPTTPQKSGRYDRVAATESFQE